MIIVDKALEKRERERKPIRVGMVGAGFMGRGIALQIFAAFKGIDLVAISNRHLSGAKRAYAEAGVSDVKVCETVAQLEQSVRAKRHAVTQDALLLCQAEGIDAIIEVTGAIEFGARVVLEAITHRKHVIMMNAELDGTIGPILKVYADKAGVVLTNCDGDQPGVTMNLYRFVKGIGIRPVLCGNIKGLQDPYRNPTTQVEFARRWKQKPHMVASFADGTKISFEQTIVANATGMRVGKRGMYGPTKMGEHIDAAAEWYPMDEISQGPGIVDYVVGAVPAPGVFILGRHDDPAQKHYLNLYKLGTGPFYCFYTPYHLCHFELPNTIARAVLFGDAAIAPAGPPRVGVVTAAKRDLQAGEVIDGMGYYMTYGVCENFATALTENLLPMGMAEGSRLKRNILKDQIVTFADVVLPEGRLCERLWAEQNAYFYPDAIGMVA